MRGPGIIGSDIFLSQGLFYAIIAFLLSFNVVTTGLNDKAQKNEADLPEIDLAPGSAAGLSGAAAQNAITLSARKRGDEVTYYLDQESVEFAKLKTTLTARKISTAKIRFDEKIVYGEYVAVLDICSQAGIKNIINVYQVKE